MSRAEFICDVVIIHQAPISIRAWIRSTKLMPDGSLQVGVKIQGQTEHQDQMYRYLALVKNLENKSKGKKF